MLPRPLFLLLALGAISLCATSSAPAADLTEAEQTVKAMLGPGTPDPIPLWPDKPPQFLENAPPEEVFEGPRIRNITVPTITVYPAPKDKASGLALIVAPGGGYGSMDWKTHTVYAAQVFNKMGVTVIGLKYRTRPPHILPNEGIQALTLLDAKRAVRTVRHHAEEWGIHPHAIGFAGYSAGGSGPDRAGEFPSRLQRGAGDLALAPEGIALCLPGKRPAGAAGSRHE